MPRTVQGRREGRVQIPSDHPPSPLEVFFPFHRDHRNQSRSTAEHPHHTGGLIIQTKIVSLKNLATLPHVLPSRRPTHQCNRNKSHQRYFRWVSSLKKASYYSSQSNRENLKLFAMDSQPSTSTQGGGVQPQPRPQPKDPVSFALAVSFSRQGIFVDFLFMINTD
jgi:hypothetical protein